MQTPMSTNAKTGQQNIIQAAERTRKSRHTLRYRVGIDGNSPQKMRPFS